MWRNVTPTFIWKAMHHEPLPLENEGIATRDFIYVEDVARGLAACALRGKPGEAYNIASGAETSIRQLAELAVELTGGGGGVQMLPKRPWDNSGKRFGSTTKAERELGFRADTSLEEGLRRTVEWTRANEALIRGNIEKHAAHMKGMT